VNQNDETSETPYGTRAIYSVPHNKVWQDNPLIEALPDTLSDGDFVKQVGFFPPFDKNVRNLPPHVRLDHLNSVFQFLLPFQNHILLYQRFTRMLRDGYVARNPIPDLGWIKLHGQIDQFKTSQKYNVEPHLPHSTLGFLIMGLSGVGKTMGVETVLRLVKQIYWHEEYKGHSLNHPQLVWLKLDCPEDASLKAMVKSFFGELDRLFGQRYTHKYYKDTKTAAQILPDVARLAGFYRLGVLIIDEIQALNRAKSGGDEVMLQFFTRLSNIMQIPVILIGTPKAKEVLNGALHQMRRNAGQGVFHWEPMNNDTQFTRFTKALWRYQFTATHTPIDDLLQKKLYEESFGIADFACKIYMLAQERAINKKTEVITTELLEQVAIDGLGQAREVIQALQATKKEQKKFADLMKRLSDASFNEALVRESTNHVSNFDNLGETSSQLGSTTADKPQDKVTSQPNSEKLNAALLHIAKAALEEKKS
jgi:hypothetical protein